MLVQNKPLDQKSVGRVAHQTNNLKDWFVSPVRLSASIPMKTMVKKTMVETKVRNLSFQFLYNYGRVLTDFEIK